MAAVKGLQHAKNVIQITDRVDEVGRILSKSGLLEWVVEGGRVVKQGTFQGAFYTRMNSEYIVRCNK